jgi:UDP-N-acetyl-D-glucosamine dehydrogenase
MNAPQTAVVIGQGYVGLPLAFAMASAGLRVTGLDSQEGVVDGLNSGKSHIDDIADGKVTEMLGRGYSATTDPTVIADADAVVICVPTPLGRHGEPDLEAVEAAGRLVAQHLRPGTLVVLESTTYPGTTDDVLKPILDTSGLTHGEEYFLAFSPERIDPGNRHYTIENTPKVVGGVTPAATRVAEAFYGQFISRVVTTRGTREAEMAKLLENTYRHVNIALVNEMARFCAELGIDIWDVIDAAATKPFGFAAFYPGPGVGGHCIPIDPRYLSYEVQRRLGHPFRFVELADEINKSMPSYVVERLQDALNDQGKTLKGSRVLLLGVTYKANVSDARETPADPVAEILIAKGAIIEYNDPHLPEWKVDDTVLLSVDLDDAIETADIVVLLQAHDAYDIDALVARSSAFFDTRGVSTSPQALRL